MDRKQYLETQIAQYDKLYWEKNDQEVSDAAYDALVLELASIDPENPLVTKVNTPILSSSNKVKHLTPMRSLDKVYTVPELLAWCSKVARSGNELFDIEPKYDGCSAEFHGGVLSTRGDGVEGDDISSKLPIIKIKKGGKEVTSEDCPEYVRGEIVLTKSDFALAQGKLKTRSGDTYKNPRNACSGLLNRDDIDTSIGPILTLIDFTEEAVRVSLNALKTLNWDYICTLQKESNYPCDGMVIKLVDEDYGITLGSTSHHSKSEVALKFTNPTGVTTLLGVELSVGKEKVTPIGKVAPVVISGVTVTNVNLHNLKYILDRDIQIGDTLVIERAGDVIPDVQNVIHSENTRTKIIMDICPACGQKTEYIEPEVFCTNADCSGKNLVKLCDSVVRLGIDELGEPTIEKMVKVLKVKTIFDILMLTVNDILTLDGFAKKSAEKLYAEISKVKLGLPEWRLLACLNLSGIGSTLSEDILSNRTIEELKEMSIMRIQTIDGMGPERAKVLYDGLIKHKDLLADLFRIIPIVKEVKIELGPTVCFTGKMPEKRSYYEGLALGAGYTPVDAVSKDLAILVCADADSTSSKAKKAEKFGVTIMKLEDFLAKIK